MGTLTLSSRITLLRIALIPVLLWLLVARRRRPPLVPVGGHRRFTALIESAFGHPGLPLRRSLVPPLSYRQLRHLSSDLGFGLDAGPADLDAVQWAGLYAFLDGGRPGNSGNRR